LSKWWVVGVCSGLAVLGSTSSARAEGFELGARVGYGLPFGETEDGEDLSDGVKGMIPLQLDLGYRVTQELSLGGYVMYGVGFVGDTISEPCDSADETPGVSASCSARDIRLGIQAQYHFAPAEKLDPWLGVGFGYEWLTLGVDVSGGGQSFELTSTGRGFEFINLQGGLDFKVARGLGLGPFLSFSMGQYSSASASCSGSLCDNSDTESRDIDDKALHQWLLLGVRGTFVVGDDDTSPD
jgi:hypothetical protein